MPVRYATDMHVSDRNSAEAFVTYGGFGSGHVFRTTDAGTTWTDISGNLPDAPCHSIVNDPVYQQNIYVGNDLGVYVTTNGGTTWNEYMTGMPYSLVFDITVVYPNRGIRATTHGNGVFERKLLQNPVNVSGGTEMITNDFELYQNYPNPFNPKTIINYELRINNFVELKVYDIAGREVATLVNDIMPAGKHEVEFNAEDLSSGVYFYSLNVDGKKMDVKRMALVK